MFVYVAPEGNIRIKSVQRLHGNMVKGCSEHVVECKMTDRLIYEDNMIKLYENSRQFAEDTNRYRIQKENELLKKKNQELTKIANVKVTKDLELEVKGQEANEYQRKIYLLKHMREWLQQSQWQENDKNSQ